MKKIYFLLILFLGFCEGVWGQGKVYIINAGFDAFSSGQATAGGFIHYGDGVTASNNFNFDESTGFKSLRIVTSKKPSFVGYTSATNRVGGTFLSCDNVTTDVGIAVIFDLNNSFSYTNNFICSLSGEGAFSAYFLINEIDRTGILISGAGGNVFCGNQTAKLTVPDYLYDTVDGFDWYISTDGNFSATPYLNTTNRSIDITLNDIKAVYPSYNGGTIYFKVKEHGNDFFETSPALTFYPSFPVPQTKSPVAPLCANGKGSIALSDFRYDDGTVYSGGENLSLTLSYIAGGIPDQTRVFTGTSISVNDLKPGNYKGQVTNASANCTSEFTFAIPDAPPALTLSITGQNADCSTGSGRVTASATGGTPPYQYAINGGASQASNVFSGLPAGTYTVVVTDANGCSSATSNAVNLTVPTAVNAVLGIKTDPTGSGLSDGQIILSANGGSGTGYTYSIDGLNYATSDTFSGLPAGTYSATAKDSKGCVSAPLSITLTQPTPLVIAISAQTNNDCYGASDGSIDVSASGGSAPYTYSINGGAYQISNSFSTLSAGSYTLSVKDNIGNTASTTATITQNADITANISKTDASCFGATGTITIDNPAGGSGTGYSYSSDGGASYQSSNTFSLASGTYSIKIKDGNQCVSAPTSITINQPAASLQATATVQDAACYFSSTGVITVSATGGSGANLYSIDNWATSNTKGVFSGLSAGTYDVKIKDQTNCAIGLSVLVKQPVELVLNIDGKTDAICFGGTGTIDVSSTGGEGNIVYSSSPVLGFANGIFSGATAGTYAITATDDNGCSATKNVTINQPTQITGSALVDAVSCNGALDGKITLSATGGTGTYTYGIKSSGTYGTNNIFSGLAAGQYVFSIKDQTECTNDLTVDVPQPNVLALSVSAKQNVLCNGADNGSLAVTATGGTGTYKYTLNGTDQGTNNSFGNLAPGNYLVRATDANGCSKELTETISQPKGLSLDLVNKVDVPCFGSATGAVTVSATGGTAPYQYAINSGVFQSGATFTALASGNYTVQVKDANDCIKTLSVTITQPSALTASTTVQHVKCFGDASGSITISALGGQAPYQYALNGGTFQISNTFSNLVAGNYTILVKDQNNCQLSANISVTHLTSKLTVQATAVSPSTCDGVGNISLSSISGGASPYQYSIDGNNYSAAQNFNNLPAGQYIFFAKDANGCIATDARTISVPGGISAQAALSHVSCFSGNNGNITVTGATGGNGNYLYSINGGAFQSSNAFTGLTAGNYSIVIRDSPYTCQYTLNATLTQPAKLNIELRSRTDISCKGQGDGRIEVLANGGTAGYQYSIDGGATYTSSGIFTALSAKNYKLWARDAQNCTESINVALAEPAVLALSLSGKSDVTCSGSNNGSLTVDASGGTPPYRYAINGGTAQTSNRFSNLPGGVYSVSLTDANGCSATISASINENPPLLLAVNSFKNVSCNGGATGELSVSATGGNGVYQYAINNGAYQSTGTFANLAAGNYSISVTDGKGCTTIITKTLTEPLALSIAKTVTQQRCFDVCDGAISLTVSGGTPPYTYSWSSGSYGNTAGINNLCGGLYKVTVTDANGCSVEDATNVVTPSEIKIANLPDTVLCVGQVVAYDAGSAGLSYLWTADNGFSKTTQKVQISEGGKYALKVTNAVGCSVSKSFTVQTSTTLLKANFLASTYANVGDTVIVVDVSKPTPSKTSWIFDTGTTVIASNSSNTIKQVRFDAPGVYNMMMMVNLGQCADAVQKSITILPRENKKEVKDALGYKEDLFTSFKIYPNPTNGEFKVTIKLSQKSDIRLSMYGFGGNLVVAPQTYANDDSFEISFNERGIPPGIYVLTLEAGNQVKTLKIIKI